MREAQSEEIKVERALSLLTLCIKWDGASYAITSY